jgi:hypothetical protein
MEQELNNTTSTQAIARSALSWEDRLHLDNIKYNMISGSIKPKESVLALHKTCKLKASISECRETAERMEM